MRESGKTDHRFIDEELCMLLSSVGIRPALAQGAVKFCGREGRGGWDRVGRG